MTNYDVVIIGTSPACVFEMAALEARGLKTLMVDREPRIGGAWGTIELPILGTVESGAHYLAAYPGVYAFYEDVLGIGLDPLTPAPKYLLPRRVFGKNHTWWHNRWGGGVSPWNETLPFTIRSWRTAISPYYRMALEVLRFRGETRKPMKYFRRGTVGLVKSLEAFIARRGLDVRLATTVERVGIDTRREFVKITTDQGDIRADRFILTSCAVLDSIMVDGEERPIPSESRPLPQLHLVIQGPPVDRLSFGQYSASPNLLLTANVTSSLQPDLIARGYSLIANLVTPTLPHTEEGVAAVMAEHRAHGLLDNRHRLVAAHWARHDVPQRQDDELMEVARTFAPYVGVLSTHSFGSAMVARVPDWRRALAPKREIN